jgi:hypothetical protein
VRRLVVAGACTVTLVSAALVAAPRAQTQEPVASPPAGRLDPDGWSVGELVEGDAPPLERFHPDARVVPSHPVTTEGIPAPQGHDVDFRHYPTADEMDAFLRALEADHPDLVEVTEIGRTARERAILAVRVASETVGDTIADRPAMYMDGQHHAREMIGSQVALYTLWRLVDGYGRDALATRLLDTRALYVIPSVNPDGNDIVLTDDQAARKTANPRACDDDRDGRFDEDPSRGYGYGTHDLARYRFQQDWADAHPDDPFVEDWMYRLVQRDPIEELGRFTGAFGGPMRPIPRRDVDGDGEAAEDEIGGTDPNRNYAFAWDAGERRCKEPDYRGARAFSEAETRAVRDFVGGLPHLSTALSYHSGVDVILHPWGHSKTAVLPDAWLFERLGRKGSQLTEVNGFPGSPHTWTARGLYDATGSTMDYLYAELGIYAFSPEVYGASGRTFVARLGTTGTFTVGISTAAAYNPPQDEILASTDRWNRFATYLLAATPNIELAGAAIEADDLVITLYTDGALPVDLTATLSLEDGSVVAADGPVRLGVDTFAHAWRVPLDGIPRGRVRLVATGVQPAATVPHPIERAAWVLDLSDEVAVVDGRLLPPVDLAASFPDGWWAPDGWDEPDRYHLPGNAPLPIEPPGAPTVAPSPTREATATQEASETPVPTVTPTATATPSLTATVAASPPATPTNVPPTPVPGVGPNYVPFASNR